MCSFRICWTADWRCQKTAPRRFSRLRPDNRHNRLLQCAIRAVKPIFVPPDTEFLGTEPTIECCVSEFDLQCRNPAADAVTREPRHVYFHRGRIQSLARTAQKCAPEPFRSSHADRILHDADRLHLHWLAHAAGAQLSLERIQRDSGRHSQVVSVFESVTDHYLASDFMISRSDGVSKRPGNVRRCMVRFQSSFLRAIAMSIPSGTLIC